MTQQQKADIRANVDGLSTYKLAERYGVSRRTITFILDPEKLKQNYEKRVERGGSKAYYKTEKHTLAMRKTRAYKTRLSFENLLEPNGDNSC